MRDEIFARNVYCAKPNTNTDAHYGSRSRKGFGAQATRSTLEYDLMTAIIIRPLTHPVTCKMSSSSFAAMSQLKVASTTWASLSIIPSTESTNREKNSIGHGSVVNACPSPFFPPRKKRIHSLCIISLHVSISEPDINDGFCLALT